MAIITDSTANYTVDDWDGHELVPAEIGSTGYKIVATHNRNITIHVAGLEFYADSLTINTKEKHENIHGTSKARPYAILGGDIDGTASVSLKTWVEKNSEDSLRMALFDALHEGRAVYFTISVDYNGDAATGGEGSHNLVTLRKCKANQDSWKFNAGSANQSSFDLDFAEDYWFGRKE